MYLFFQAELEYRKHWVESEVLSLYGLPAQAVPHYFCDNAFCSRKAIKNFNILELLKFCWIQQFQQSAIMLALPIEIESDLMLIQRFGDGYLGCVSSAVRKSELLKLALSYDRLIKAEGSRRLFALPKFVIEERLKHSPFSEVEIRELTKVQEMNLKLVDQFIAKKTQEIRKDLDSYPKILKRGIGLEDSLN